MSDLNESAEEGAKRVEHVLETPTARQLRELVVDTLDPQADERILSIGCGPGYEPASLAKEDVGQIIGVDLSRESLEIAAERCADSATVSLVQGDANRLPVADGQFDAAVAKQVYQFIPDIDNAMCELTRILKPGGRAVVVSPDVDADVMNTSNRDRMRRVQAAYRDALPNPHLGSRLSTYAGEVGLTVEQIEPYTVVQQGITARVEQGTEVHRQIAEADDSIDSSEVAAWERELRELDEEGEFFRSGTQFVYLLRKPT